MKNKIKLLRNIVCGLLCLALLGTAVLLGINAHVKASAGNYILSAEDASALSDVDCILVLGCGVRDDGTPSDMLRDRLLRGIELYELGAAPKLLMSGDHGRTTYDEVNIMKGFAVDAGMASSSVFMDHAGFSTYDTVCRAKEIFQAQKVIIVTQTYHLYRAMYIAKQIGLEAYGVAAEYRQYGGQLARDIREVLARVKDFGMSILQPEPVYLGEAIPISGNGELTHDDKSNFS